MKSESDQTDSPNGDLAGQAREELEQEQCQWRVQWPLLTWQWVWIWGEEEEEWMKVLPELKIRNKPCLCICFRLFWNYTWSYQVFVTLLKFLYHWPWPDLASLTCLEDWRTCHRKSNAMSVVWIYLLYNVSQVKKWK